MSRGYNILIEELSDYITLFGENYPVNTSHRNWIKISILLETKGLDDKKAVAEMLRLCYREKLPPTIGSAVVGMIAFLKGDTELSVSSDEKRGQKICSFSDDASIIYSTFYQKYGIDLSENDIHWHKFCALFEGLADDNPFKTLIKIRTVDETKVKDATKRRKIKELKNKYAIKTNTTVDVAESISSLF